MMFRKIFLNRSILLGVILLAIVTLLTLGGFFESLDSSAYDEFFSIRGKVNPGLDVVIIGIDDASIEKIGPLAWPRSIHARLLQKLQYAKVVGFDLLFDVPSSVEEDAIFADAISTQGNVVLASKFDFEKDEQGQEQQIFKGPIEVFLNGAAGLGFVNMPTDFDGVVRHATLFDTNTFDLPLPSLALSVAMVARGLSPDQLTVKEEQLFIDKYIIPLGDSNKSLPDFLGPKDTFKTYSYADVLSGKIPASVFKDKIVLVGATAPILKDYFPTPFTTSNMVLSGNLPTTGVEIHATVVQSFLTGHWYQKTSQVVNLAVLFLLGFLAPIIFRGRGPWLGLLAAFTMALLTSVWVYSLWRYFSLWLSLGGPLVLIFLNYVVGTSADFVEAEMARRQTKAMFSRYVSPEFVEELLKDPTKLALGGQREDITVMFCDIRGFTAYSEGKDPAYVVTRLNTYLGEITKIIFNHGGTLDKYLGDGLMAIFGAPLRCQNHALRAINCALEISKEVELLNQQYSLQDETPFKIGIGINSGSALVGNVGSLKRMDYTAMGEEVNLASRMEGLTKTFQENIIISERSINSLEDVDKYPWELVALGQAEVKGFSKAIEIYTVRERSQL